MEECTVGCVYGLQPRIERINVFSQARWRKFGFSSVSKVNQELFLFQFDNEEGCDNYWLRDLLLLIIIL